jgi:hypothetical protein
MQVTYNVNRCYFVRMYQPFLHLVYTMCIIFQLWNGLCRAFFEIILLWHVQPKILGFTLTFFLTEYEDARLPKQIRPTLHKEWGPKKLGANFGHFFRVIWPQVTNKCKNIGPKGYRLASPNLMGPIQGHKVQHLLITWGQIEKIFFDFSLNS